MKMISLLWTLLISFQVIAITSGEAETKACDKISCNDLAPEERYHCFEQKKLCHRRAFTLRVEEWKQNGIDEKRRREVLKALEDALIKNKEVTVRLQKEVGELQNDMKQIEEQIKTVRKLKTAK